MLNIEMTELSRLISRLQKGIARNASYVATIRHPHLLVASLQELNELIGNEKVKDAVATQVSHLIMVKRRAIEDCTIKEDEVMLNTVLYGPPGVGKTLIGTKLAKIWYSLGYLNGSKNSKEKKQDFKDLLKDMFKDGNGTDTTSTSSTMDTGLTMYILFMFVIIFITFLSMAWRFYGEFGGVWTLVGIFLIIFIIISFAYFIGALNSSNATATIDTKTNDKPKSDSVNGIKINNSSGTNSMNYDLPKDEDIIKVVSRPDFVGKWLGYTAPKTNTLLEENLGKVLFVDECYSLVTSAHDDYGMEALTALNLFMSQHPGEIIIIFAGYKDLIEAGPFAVQPGLKRRFMWQFESTAYTGTQLFEIMKLQATKKGWGFIDEKEILKLVKDNSDAFEGFGGDTERALFFAQLEHSREFIANEKGMAINRLTPKHVALGIKKLRDNTLKSEDGPSSNPMANIMKMFRGQKLPNSPKTQQSKTRETMSAVVEELEDEEEIEEINIEKPYNPYSDKSEFDGIQHMLGDESVMAEVINNVLQKRTK
jgi:hypothetical protein